MHKSIRRLLITACVLLGTQTAAIAQSIKAAVEIVERSVSDGDIPGASVLVLRNDKTLVARAFGICDLKQGRKFHSNTICWIASLTKPVTAAAAMTLVQQDKLDLDASIDVYLPEFRNQTTRDGRHLPVTLRQLMSHASGIQSSVPLRPRFFFDPTWYNRSLQEVAPAIANTPLEFDPGTRVEYSNAAPYIVGRIVEVVSGESFGEYVKTKVLQPLGMDDTGFSISPEKAMRAAVVYRRESRSAVEFCRYDPQWQVTMTMPDGGLFSTPADMAKFARVFLNGGEPILSAASVEQMLSPQSAGYGLGWILDEPNQFSHWGSSGTLIWGDRQTDTIGVVFIQMQDRNLVADIHRRFRQAVTRAMP